LPAEKSAWTPPPSTLRSIAETKEAVPQCSRNYVEATATLAPLAAKARGEKCHKGPLQLRKALPGRDCTKWVEEDKQYRPYCSMEAPTNIPSPKPKKPPAPPRLWLPAERSTKDASRSLQSGGSGDPSSPSKPSKSLELSERPSWDTEHHVMFSRMNHEINTGFREYFEKPKRKDSEAVVRCRETYVMSDRQCGWNDEPEPLGESRRTFINNIGPVNVGGCREQQMPSYWRKIGNWRAYSMPSLTAQTGLGAGPPKPGRNPDGGHGHSSLIVALADAPADQSTKFWRDWAKQQSKLGQSPRKRREPHWDDRWAITSSKDNTRNCSYKREYFSVPPGKPGRSGGPRHPRQHRLQRQEDTYGAASLGAGLAGAVSAAASSESPGAAATAPAKAAAAGAAAATPAAQRR